MSEYAVIIEREAGADSASAYAADPDLHVVLVRDASVSDDDLLAEFRELLAEHFAHLRADGHPVPAPACRAVMIAPAA